MKSLSLSFSRRSCRFVKVFSLLWMVLPPAKPALAALPPGWSDADLGSPGLAGSAGDTNGYWTVTGGGSDIWNNADQFNFVSATSYSDGTLIAQVTGIQNSDPGSGWSKAGLMFRNDSTAGSVNVSIVATAGQGLSFQWRPTAGGACSYAQVSGITVPVWLQLIRSGQTFTGSYSTDGINWVQVSSQQIPMNSTVLAGLDVTAHNNSALNTSHLHQRQLYGRHQSRHRQSARFRARHVRDAQRPGGFAGRRHPVGHDLLRGQRRPNQFEPPGRTAFRSD